MNDGRSLALMVIFFPDTNFFLHFKDPSELPWADVTSNHHVRLVVCGNTQRELDKKKFELRGRAQQRARKWVSIIGELIVTEEPKELRAAGPKVTVELHLDRPAGWVAPGDLDASILGDDSYVADVLAFQEATGNYDCALLTADTGPLGKAKRHSLRAVSIMRPGWELPEETDTRDKQIHRLQKELEEARQEGPTISLTTTVDGKLAKEIAIEVVRYPALPQLKISELIEELERLHPRVIEFPRPDGDSEKTPAVTTTGSVLDLANIAVPFDWVGPTEEQIAAYSTAYDNWLAKARQVIETVPVSTQQSEFEAVFRLSLANVGVAAAEDVWVSMQATAGLLLRDEKVDDARTKAGEPMIAAKTTPVALGAPPTAPRWKKVYRERARSSLSSKLAGLHQSSVLAAVDRVALLASRHDVGGLFADQERMARLIDGPLRGISGLDDMRLLGGAGAFPESRAWIHDVTRPLVPPMPKPRNPEVFYRRSRHFASGSERWEFECTLLRHHIEPKVWTVPVVAQLGALPPKGGSVELKVHARNLRKPLEISFPVRIAVRDEDTESLVRAFLPSSMHR